MLGQTPVLDAAIKGGKSTDHPEFTGTGIGLYKLPNTTNPQQAYNEVSAYYEPELPHHLASASVRSQRQLQVLCTSQSKAQSLSLTTISASCLRHPI